jgi:TolB protein
VWFPGAEKIVFVDYDESGGREQVYLANLDGSESHQLTQQPVAHLSPTVSPDGRWVALVRLADPLSQDTSSELVLIHPDVTGESVLVDGIPREQTGLAWSPIGDWIAFAGRQMGRHDIYLLKSDGSRVINVTQTENVDEVFPAWRPQSSP